MSLIPLLILTAASLAFTIGYAIATPAGDTITISGDNNTVITNSAAQTQPASD